MTLINTFHLQGFSIGRIGSPSGLSIQSKRGGGHGASETREGSPLSVVQRDVAEAAVLLRIVHIG